MAFGLSNIPQYNFHTQQKVYPTICQITFSNTLYFILFLLIQMPWLL